MIFCAGWRIVVGGEGRLGHWSGAPPAMSYLTHLFSLCGPSSNRRSSAQSRLATG
jgi:hypothetical protein